MDRRLRVAVVGYGTGGQATALMLAGDGHQVQVFERAPELGPVGAGFLLQPVGQWVLWQLGLLDTALAYAAPVSRLYGETVAGRAVMDMRYAELDPRLRGLGMQRAALFSVLDAAWTEGRQLHCGVRIVRVDSDRGVLEDDRGRRYEGFDLVVVADGAASGLRGQVSEARVDRPYPWGAQWCLVQACDWPWRDVLQQRYVGARRMAGMLPVGTRPGDPVPRLSFFWSLPADELGEAARDGDAWRASVQAVWPQALERLADTPVPGGLAQARYRDAMHACWHRGRAVLLGDAAHAMSPQLGQGVNMALLDAHALRDALRHARSVGEGLARYASARRAHVGIYHLWSRWLTPLFQSERDAWARLRDLCFHTLSRTPGARGQMLRVLSGTRSGWFGRFALPEDFLDAMGTRLASRPSAPADEAIAEPDATAGRHEGRSAHRA